MIPRICGATAALLVVAGAWAEPAAAQAGMGRLLGIGYVANAPDMMAGATVWGVIPGLRGWGLYVDGKLDLDDPADRDGFDPDLTPDQVAMQYPEDDFLVEDDGWLGANAAVVREFTTELILYAGAGLARQKVYRQYYDPSGGRGALGYYWVEDEEASGTRVNLLGGALLRISSRLRIQFGMETQPRGFSVGTSLTWPAR